MKKLFCLLMVLFALLLTSAALAESNEALLIMDGKSTTYQYFSDAFDAAQGHTATIKLLTFVYLRRDATMNSGDITIDTNSKTIFLCGGYDCNYEWVAGSRQFAVNGGNLTFLGEYFNVYGDAYKTPFIVKGGSLTFAGNCWITKYGSSYTNLLDMYGGTLRITGDVEFYNEHSYYQSGAAVYIGGGTAQISNGTFKSIGLFDDPADTWEQIFWQALKIGGNANVTITGGNFWGITASKTLNNYIPQGYVYDCGGSITTGTNTRSLEKSETTVRYEGIPQTALDVTITAADGTPVDAIIRPNHWPQQHKKESYYVNVTGGDGSGKLTVSLDKGEQTLPIYLYNLGESSTKIQVEKTQFCKAFPVKVTATKEGDDVYYGTSTTVEILMALNLVSDCAVSVEAIDYDGYWHEPQVKLTIPEGYVSIPKRDESGQYIISQEPHTLIEDVDYRIEMESQCAPGTYTFKVIGLDGLISGEKTYTWTINKAKFNSETIRASITNPGVPAGEAVYSVFDTVHNTYLQEGVDFETDYVPSSDPGIHTFRMRGIGVYEGSIDVSWSVAAVLSDENVTVNTVYDSLVPSVTVKYGEQTLVKDTDYTVTYPAVAGPGHYSVTVTGIGAWSGKVTKDWDVIYTLRDNNNYTFTIPSCQFTGDEQTPPVYVTSNVENRELVLNTDFTVEYSNNTAITDDTNKAQVTITGIGLYTGTVTKTFRILNGAQVEGKVGDNESSFDSFSEAFGAYFSSDSLSQEPVTITLQSDQSCDSALPLFNNGRTLTLNLNGHTLTAVNLLLGIGMPGPSAQAATSTINIIGPGKIVSPNGFAQVFNGGNLNLQNVEFATGQESSNTVICTTADSAYVSLNNCKFSCVYALDFQAGTAVINGGTYTTSAQTISTSGKLTINGGKFESQGTVINGEGGELTINGGSFTSTDSTTVVSVSSETTKLVVSGGTFTCAYSTDVESVGLYVGSGVDVTLSGGTFKGTGALNVGGGLMKALAENKEYTLNGVMTDFGTATSVFSTLYGNAEQIPGGFSDDKIVTVRVEKKKIDLENGEWNVKAAEPVYYTGEPVCPDVKVVHKETKEELTVGTDFTVSYANNIDAYDNDANKQYATFTVEGCGDYKGTLNGKFIINLLAIGDVTTVQIPNAVYDGTAKTPEVQVWFADKLLVQNTDYTVTVYDKMWGQAIDNPVQPGKYAVLIGGKGNFTNAQFFDWSVKPKELSETDVEVSLNLEYSYDVRAIVPVVEVKYGEVTLKAGEHYSLKAQAALTSGNYTAEIEFLSPYAGRITKPYEVHLLSETEVQVETLTYDGYSQSPSFTLKDGEYTLVQDTDYTMDLAQYTNSGEYTITPLGKGKYCGPKEITWKIAQYCLKEEDIKLIDYYTTYPEIPEYFISMNGNDPLTEDLAYKIEVDDTPGAAYFTITGIGNFCGTVRIPWELLEPEWYIRKGKLIVTADFTMDDYTEDDKAPWYTVDDDSPWYGEEFTSVEIREGVTSIGSYAFAGDTALQSITIPESVTSIGENAFGSNVKVYCSDPSQGLITALGADRIIILHGNCGGTETSPVTYVLTADGTQIISGSGAMDDYTEASPAPWSSKASSITSVEIGSGVTGICINAFAESIKLYCSNPSASIRQSTYASRIILLEGNCGGTEASPVTYALTADRKLTISGTGAMTDYTGESRAPWNSKKNDIKSVVINSGVTHVGAFSFAEFSGDLTQVTLPDSVTSIGNYAFAVCGALDSINIPSGLTSIGEGAFYGCDRLTSVVLPAGVTSIGASAFEDCFNLSSVTLPADATIGSGAFDNCSSNLTYTYAGKCGTNVTYVLSNGTLTISGTGAMTDYTGESLAPWYSKMASITSVVINSGVTHVGACSFAAHGSLTQVTLPDSVTSIGNWAFAVCGALDRINIPSGLTSIGDGVFTGCWRLTSVVLPAGVTSIGASAFEGCSSLSSVTLPADATIGIGAFDETTKLYCSNPSDSLKTSAYASRIIVLHGTCGGTEASPVTYELTAAGKLTISGSGKMADYESSYYQPWYKYCSSINSIVINKGVTYLGQFAFGGCENLTSVSLPEGLTSIGGNTFRECKKLSGISLPTSLTSIGVAAFYGCTSLESVEIPGSVTSIGNYAFTGCTSLSSIKISNGVTSIGENTFSQCTSLKSVEIPSSVTSIGEGAFFRCTKLTDVTLPTDAQVGSDAFFNCSSTLAFTYTGSCSAEGSNVTYALNMKSGTLILSGTGAMADYTEASPAPWDSKKSNITSAEIGSGVTGIGSNAFIGCTGLTSVTLPASVTSIGSYALGYQSATEKIANFTIKGELGSAAMKYAYDNGFTFTADVDTSKMSTLTLPAAIKRIEAESFYGVAAEVIVIPAGCEAVAADAFTDCPNLKVIINHSSVELTLPWNIYVIKK